MENSMIVSQPVETQMDHPIKPKVPDIDLNPMAFQAELAKIAAEQGLVVDKSTGNAVPVGSPSNPRDVPAFVQAQAATQPPAMASAAQPVPDKFKAPDGQLDIAKVEKSYLHAEDALKKYQEKERELRQKQAEVGKLQNQSYVAPVQPQAQQYNQPQGFGPEYINRRLDALKDPGAVIYEAANLAYIQAKAETEAAFASQIQSLQGRLESQDRNRELERIAKDDPWVLSDEGINTLASLRSEYPHLNSSPQPWAEAYDKHLAMRSRQGLSGSVNTPTPAAQTAKAPPTPVNAGSQSPSFNVGSLANDPAKLNALLNSLPDEKARQAFWAQILPGANKGV